MSGMHIRAMIHCSMLAGYLVGFPILGWGQEAGEQKSIRMTCGTCPDGYATTGTTQAPSVCKDGDPTLVQCVPLGANEPEEVFSNSSIK